MQLSLKFEDYQLGVGQKFGSQVPKCILASFKLAPLVPVESTSAFHSSNLTILFNCLFLLISELPFPYINSIFHYYSLIHSDEGLKLETSVFESFAVVNLSDRSCG